MRVTAYQIRENPIRIEKGTKLKSCLCAANVLFFLVPFVVLASFGLPTVAVAQSYDEMYSSTSNVARRRERNLSEQVEEMSRPHIANLNTAIESAITYKEHCNDKLYPSATRTQSKIYQAFEMISAKIENLADTSKTISNARQPL